MNQGPRADLLSREDVAELVGLPLRKVTWWVYALRENRRYSRFVIPRRSGGDRQISAPIKPIRDMQDAIRRHLDGFYEPAPHVHGFTTGRSPLSNAATHERQEWVLRVDLADFFPSINFGRVRGMFQSHPFEYPPDVATLLAQVVCHRNELPQGASTSPVISNLICRGLDKELQRLARVERSYYTRYADDLTFSTQRKSFPTALATVDSDGMVIVGERLREIIEGQGFAVNHKKTRLVRRTQRQRVTGLVVNERANVSRTYLRDLRSALYIWRRYGRDVAEARYVATHPARGISPGKSPSFARTLAGRIQYVGSVRGWTDSTYRSLALGLQALDPAFQPRTLRELHTEVEVVLYTEGESDVLHLLKALEHFHAQGEFTNLRLRVTDKSPCGGDAELLAMALRLEETPQPIPCVCVFDRDNQTVLDKAVGPTGARPYRNRVGAVAIDPPAWRLDSDGVCIEMLYRDEDLALRDSDGRRIYLSSEFQLPSGHHLSEPVHLSQAKAKTLVRDDVFAFDGGRSVGLSKVAFAEYVANGTSPFDSVDFEGFRPTLEAVAEMAARIA